MNKYYEEGVSSSSRGHVLKKKKKRGGGGGGVYEIQGGKTKNRISQNDSNKRSQHTTQSQCLIPAKGTTKRRKRKRKGGFTRFRGGGKQKMGYHKTTQTKDHNIPLNPNASFLLKGRPKEGKGKGRRVRWKEGVGG
jgi:hypothetical protein